ncbi:hypothetical protein [Aquamicrobium zhengzhouense]|uniref:hypothetical protein n=1 Tax=Aquamicrobium zhengzhouense TaxID=2781738 RepID=UPI0018E15412|nr:hypothetical protein [Aquamicrobium zhengzhouense]
MTLKILLIIAGAAAFGWGFSEIVEHSDNSIRSSQDAGLNCQDWASGSCERTFER